MLELKQQLNNRSTIIDKLEEVLEKAVHVHTALEEAHSYATEQEAEALSNIFKLFGDKNRLRILLALYECPQCGCDLVQRLGMTKSAISHQLAILRQNKLVTYKKEGKHAIYRLADEHVIQMLTPAITHVKEC